MSDGPSSDLLAAVAADPPAQNGDKIDQLRQLCEDYRDLEAALTDAEERVAEMKTRRHKIRAETIPDKMDQCGVQALDLAAHGNHPAVKIELRPDVGANIAASWPDEKRRVGFEALEANEAGDLIKTKVELFFPREQRADAVKLIEGLNKLKVAKGLGFEIELTESVHPQTLSAWLRERIKKGLATPLDAIGGHVGRVATIKPGGGKK